MNECNGAAIHNETVHFECAMCPVCKVLSESRSQLKQIGEIPLPKASQFKAAISDYALISAAVVYARIQRGEDDSDSLIELASTVANGITEKSKSPKDGLL